ncbi:MAG: hypothetical protein CME59_16100 [Halioglobus sp.]|nr:hypothetical protein [Halioglobus sp.]|tara:strand:- start:11746 stop:12366 length:621 start_codon:yes stop_codon:yes gene_type:complete
MVFEIKANTFSPDAIKAIKEQPRRWAYGWAALQLCFMEETLGAGEDFVLFIIGSAFIVYFLAKKLITWSNKTRTHIVLDEDEFRIKDGREWVCFGRRRNHSFALHPHENIRNEQRELEHKRQQAAREGEIMKIEPLYEDSFHLIYLDMGQPYYLIDIHGLRTATAIHRRLQACDAYLDQHIKMGSGQIIDPDDEWDDGPGDIDEWE